MARGQFLGLSRHSIYVLFVTVAFASPGFAEEIATPSVHEQDNWAYRETREVNGVSHQSHQELTVVHASASGILVSAHEIGSNLPPKEVLLGADWSRSRNVNGENKVVNRPFLFPLSMGKSWVVDYKEDNPNRAHKSETFHSKYSVVGWEDVSVPAGTFKALKIESDGQWTAELAPSASTVSVARVDGQGATALAQTNRVTAQTATGRLYKAFWYVPSVKRYVKAVEEYYSTNAVLSSRNMEELEAFNVGK